MCAERIKLYKSSKEYMDRFGSPYLGLDIAGFWDLMAVCFAELLAAAEPDRRIVPEEDLLPTLTLSPAPAEWPDPAQFLEHEQERPE